jgi:hypothetical protein
MRSIVLNLSLIFSLLVSGLAKDRKDNAKPYQPSPIHLDRDGEKWAEKTLHKLSVEQKVGQLFMIWVRAQFLNVDSPDYLQLRRANLTTRKVLAASAPRNPGRSECIGISFPLPM